MSQFADQIKAFNQMYKLPAPARPTMPPTRKELSEQLQRFKDILLEEVSEVDDIIAQMEVKGQKELLAEIADWLGDMQVYCASEMLKYGLDNDVVLGIIMASNGSKLGEDGQPIYDERGKVMKGPNYWKPEPQIERYIVAMRRQTPEES